MSTPGAVERTEKAILLEQKAALLLLSLPECVTDHDFDVIDPDDLTDELVEAGLMEVQETSQYRWFKTTEAGRAWLVRYINDPISMRKPEPFSWGGVEL